MNWRFDITYGVKKEQNIESHFLTFWFLTFWSFNVLIFQCSDHNKKLLMFWPFDVLNFDVPTPSRTCVRTILSKDECFFNKSTSVKASSFKLTFYRPLDQTKNNTLLENFFFLLKKNNNIFEKNKVSMLSTSLFFSKVRWSV